MPAANNNFTPQVQKALALAHREADRLHHNFVGTEHLLLGLISLGQGVAVAVIRKRGLEAIRLEVEKQIAIRPDQSLAGQRPYTPGAKKVLALASKEATKLNHDYVGTEHLLLGFLQEVDEVPGRVLREMGVELEATRQEIVRETQARGQVDITKRYDVYCRDGDQIAVYRNVLFKGFGQLLELEQSDGSPIFVPRGSLVKFCEPGTSPI